MYIQAVYYCSGYGDNNFLNLTFHCNIWLLILCIQ